MDVEYIVSSSIPKNCPIEIIFSLLCSSDSDVYEVPQNISSKNINWGESSTIYIAERSSYPTPIAIDSLWIALADNKVYSIETELDTNIINECIYYLKSISKSQIYIVVGYAPYDGFIYLWVRNKEKSKIVFRGKGTSVLEDTEIYPFNSLKLTISDYCKNGLSISKFKIPPRDLFDKYMRQYTYRYYPMFEKWNEDDEKWEKYDEEKDVVPQFEYIEEMLTDGTHDKLHDDGLLKYHEAGKPKKLAMKWWVKKSEYVAYFWFDDEVLCPIFEKFYGAHRDTKVDFRLRIDAKKKKYELSLFRQGLKEPQVLPEDAYQLLVFKSQFENYRSDNYNQERGAWVW